METLLTTVLSSALFLSTSFAAPAAPANDVVFTRVLHEENYVGYVVEKDSSVEAIALQAYGSEDYWTTVWNDNMVITDPDVIPAGTVLKMRIDKPEQTEELISELTERNDAILAKKNEEYLKRLTAIMMAEPTVVPTQAPVQAQPAAPQSLSEEAITYLGQCEAGMDPAKNTGNGYYGAFQFSQGTWNSMNTGYARADLAPIEVQKAAVQRLLARSSIYNQFPGCAKKMRGAGLI